MTLERVKQVTLEQIALYIAAIWRHSTTILICLGLVYGLAKQIVTPYAQEAVVQMMVDAGVDPTKFKSLLDETKKLSEDTGAIHEDLEAVRKQNSTQIDTLKKLENNQAAAKRELEVFQDNFQGQINRIEKSVDKLLGAVLEIERTDLAVPPEELAR